MAETTKIRRRSSFMESFWSLFCGSKRGAARTTTDSRTQNVEEAVASGDSEQLVQQDGENLVQQDIEQQQQQQQPVAKPQLHSVRLDHPAALMASETFTQKTALSRSSTTESATPTMTTATASQLVRQAASAAAAAKVAAASIRGSQTFAIASLVHPFTQILIPLSTTTEDLDTEAQQEEEPTVIFDAPDDASAETGSDTKEILTAQTKAATMEATEVKREALDETESETGTKSALVMEPELRSQADEQQAASAECRRTVGGDSSREATERHEFDSQLSSMTDPPESEEQQVSSSSSHSSESANGATDSSSSSSTLSSTAEETRRTVSEDLAKASSDSKKTVEAAKNLDPVPLASLVAKEPAERLREVQVHVLDTTEDLESGTVQDTSSAPPVRSLEDVALYAGRLRSELMARFPPATDAEAEGRSNDQVQDAELSAIFKAMAGAREAVVLDSERDIEASELEDDGSLQQETQSGREEKAALEPQQHEVKADEDKQPWQSEQQQTKLDFYQSTKAEPKQKETEADQDKQPLKPEQHDMKADVYQEAWKPEQQGIEADEDQSEWKPEQQGMKADEDKPAWKPEQKVVEADEDKPAWKPEQKDVEADEDKPEWKPDQKDVEAVEDKPAWKPEQKDVEAVEDKPAWKPEQEDVEAVEDKPEWKPEQEDVEAVEDKPAWKPDQKDVEAVEDKPAWKPEKQGMEADEDKPEWKPEQKDVEADEDKPAWKPEQKEVEADEDKQVLNLDQQHQDMESATKNEASESDKKAGADQEKEGSELELQVVEAHQDEDKLKPGQKEEKEHFETTKPDQGTDKPEAEQQQMAGVEKEKLEQKQCKKVQGSEQAEELNLDINAFVPEQRKIEAKHFKEEFTSEQHEVETEHVNGESTSEQHEVETEQVNGESTSEQHEVEADDSKRTSGSEPQATEMHQDNEALWSEQVEAYQENVKLESSIQKVQEVGQIKVANNSEQQEVAAHWGKPVLGSEAQKVDEQMAALATENSGEAGQANEVVGKGSQLVNVTWIPSSWQNEANKDLTKSGLAAGQDGEADRQPLDGGSRRTLPTEATSETRVMLGRDGIDDQSAETPESCVRRPRTPEVTVHVSDRTNTHSTIEARSCNAAKLLRSRSSSSVDSTTNCAAGPAANCSNADVAVFSMDDGKGSWCRSDTSSVDSLHISFGSR